MKPVQRILHEIAEREVPESTDLWASIRGQLPSHGTPSRWARRFPAGRLGWALMAVMLFLALGAVGYASAPVLSRVLGMDAGLQYVDESQLGQAVELAQTIDGITVTLERVYADANRIVVGYTVRGPEGLTENHRLFPVHEMLTDASGTVFSGYFMLGVTGQSDILDVSLPPGEGVYAVTFDGAAVEGQPAELELRFSMDVETHVLSPATPVVSDTGERGPRTVIQASVAPAAPPLSTAGPFTFDFSVPFTPGRTVEIGQRIESAGIAVTLERVVITPSETRAFLCAVSLDESRFTWLPILSLDTGRGPDLHGGSIQLGAGKGHYDGGSEVGTEKGCYLASFPYALHDRQGEWTLRVSEFFGSEHEQPYEDTRLAGPWEFRFQVP